MKKVYLSLLSLLTVSAFADPVVSNIRASQRENTKLVDILYDVSYSAGSNVSVTCEVSTNSGASYTNVLAKSFSGNGYGVIVTTGNDRLITWDAGVDWNEKYSEQMKVRITAKSPRFTVNQNSYYDDNGSRVYSAGDTVTDNQTGLIWATRPLSSGTTTTFNHSTAMGRCAALGEGWRLPMLSELSGLLDTNRIPALPSGHPFKNVRNDPYWTLTFASSLSSHYVVSLMNGYVDDTQSNLSSPTYSVWPVRSVY